MQAPQRFAVRRAACPALTEEYTHASTSDRPPHRGSRREHHRPDCGHRRGRAGLRHGTGRVGRPGTTGEHRSVDVNETIADVGTFAGTFTPTRFVTSNGVLSVLGTVTGTLTDANGVVTPVTGTASSQIVDAAANGTCKILDLALGPLHLDLLGLVVDLNQVHLTITAVPGAGNLLGNLLCAIAGLLDGGNIGGLATLLNRLLGL